MKTPLLLLASVLSFASLLSSRSFAAEPEFPLTEDSKAHDGIAKGELIKATYTAKEGSLFPGTEREYQIYLPPNLDKSKPAPFMVFQDGVIYNAPTVFDNLIAKKDIPPLIGIFIKPGVVPAANDNALPRYNRSYEYDSVTDNYARFLIDEFLPAIKAKHGLNLSDDPNARAIAGNSSGGICAFMVAWHRPDQFRRVFTGVGTYVGIHGADQLPVLVRKYEPKPLRVYLQSGENDNNLYCGDWWLANQMMERSLTWNGYEVNHTWGTGGHNARHATQIFPDVLRWLWKGYPNEPVKANPREDARWVGGHVVGDGDWKQIKSDDPLDVTHLKSSSTGQVFGINNVFKSPRSFQIQLDDKISELDLGENALHWCFAIGVNGSVYHPAILSKTGDYKLVATEPGHQSQDICPLPANHGISDLVVLHSATVIFSDPDLFSVKDGNATAAFRPGPSHYFPGRLASSPDQTMLFATTDGVIDVMSYQIGTDGKIGHKQKFGMLERSKPRAQEERVGGLCVDTNGWLYVATSLGIQVLDQAGRVNFIIPTPKPPHDVCFGGKDLSDLFIACGDTIYKRPTKAHGYISGQMAPIKPPAPKL